MDERLNLQLVEKFGELEKLCNEIYDDKHGVTLYIEDMKNSSPRARGLAPYWDYSLNKLKEVRHKRNCLSHGEVSFSTPYAEKEDIDFILEFKNRLINNSDPIALNSKTAKNAATTKKGYSLPNTSSAYNKYKGCTILFVLGASILLLGLLMIFNLLNTL